MAVFSVKSPTRRCLWISVFLLLIFIQMLTSLVLFAGVFILSDKVVISPFHFPLTHEHREVPWYMLYYVSGAQSEIKMDILITVITVGLYSPVVLVAFALLAMLLAVYAKDRATLWLSMACQAASSLLILTGITVFLLLHQSYVSWEDMTIWFYICVAVQLELIVTTVLTWVSGRKITSDWEYIDPGLSLPV